MTHDTDNTRERRPPPSPAAVPDSGRGGGYSVPEHDIPVPGHGDLADEAARVRRGFPPAPEVDWGRHQRPPEGGR